MKINWREETCRVLSDGTVAAADALGAELYQPAGGDFAQDLRKEALRSLVYDVIREAGLEVCEGSVDWAYFRGIEEGTSSDLAEFFENTGYRFGISAQKKGLLLTVNIYCADLPNLTGPPECGADSGFYLQIVGDPTKHGVYADFSRLVRQLDYINNFCLTPPQDFWNEPRQVGFGWKLGSGNHAFFMYLAPLLKVIADAVELVERV